MANDTLQPGMMRDLDGNVVPIPQGSTVEALPQPQMMTDLQGNRVPIPQGSTVEPLSQSAPAAQPAPENPLFKKHPANLLYRDIRSHETPDQIAARQATAKEASERIMQPVTTNDLMTPEQQKEHPIVAGVSDIATGMLTPTNIAFMAGTAGLGTLAGPEAKLASAAMRTLSATFSASQIMDAAKESPEAWDAIKRGDSATALRLITHIVGNVAFAAQAGHHAAGIEPTPSTGWGEKAQQYADMASHTVRQTFQSDANNLATANAQHKAAQTLYDQRFNEHSNAVQSAGRAIQAVDQAKADLASGKINQQQFDDINSAASQTASNVRKASQALAEAHDSRSTAAADVDKYTRKINKSHADITDKQTKDIAGAKEDFMRAIPSARKGAAAYTDQDYEVGRQYLEDHHENVGPLNTTQDVYDALDGIERDLNHRVQPSIEKYAKEPITTNVRMDVRDRLAESLGGKTRADFTSDAMKSLEGYNLIDPTIEEADAIRQQLNSEIRDNLKRNFRDIQTALDVDPDFAAKYYALESLRDGIYGALEERGVEGAREIRQDQKSIIKLRNAAEDQIKRGEVKVRGSGESGPFRKAAAAGVRRGSVVAGASLGAGTGSVFGLPGAVVGGAAGAELGAIGGEWLGKKIAPGDLTRNDLIQNSFKVKGGGVPMTETAPGTASPQTMRPPNAVSPVMQLYTPQRELTPLHSELATHYGEDMNQSGYIELEKRFKDDVADKRNHNVPLESDEKSLLGKINAADAADRLAAQKQTQEMAAKGQEQIPTVNLPDKFDPLLQMPESKLHEATNTHKAIQHELAHAIVADARGLTPIDGVRSHLHPTNVSDGSLASVPIDKSEFLDKDGEVDWNKIKSRIPDIVTTYMAGGVANDLYHGIPLHENQHLGADVSELRAILKNVGFTPAEIDKHISLGAEAAASILSQPGVQDVIERHAAVREAGLSDKYHVSPDRMEQILKDTNEVIHETGTSGKSSKSARTGERAVKENGAGAKAEAKEGDSAAVRQTGKRPSGPKNKATEGNGSARTAEPAIKKDSYGHDIAPKFGPQEPDYVYRTRPVGQTGIGSESHAQATASPEEAAGYRRDLEEMTGKPHEVVKVNLSKLGENQYTRKPGPNGSDWVKFNSPVEETAVERDGMTPADVTKSAGLVYKGEVTPGSGVHMIEDSEHPGKTAAIREPFTAEQARQKMDSKIAEFAPKFDQNRVSTRVPSGKDATENPLEGEPLEIGRAALEKSPQKLQDKFADKAREVPGVKVPKNITDNGKVYDRFIRHIADNLKWLHDITPPEVRNQTKQWYDSANKMAHDWASQHGYEPHQIAGAIASLSPQTEWDTNVSLAKRLVDIHKNHLQDVVTPEMIQKGESIIKESRKGKDKKANTYLEGILHGLEGKKIGDLQGTERAAAARLYDEVNNSREFRRIDPGTGREMEVRTNTDGSPAAAGWGNFNNMAKALSILDDGSRANISAKVGDSHKVRNFYNNIIDPSHPNDVTMDTHAVGAATLLPVSGNTPLVTDNFGAAGKNKATGVVGNYPLYAEGYRLAAKELGLKARELQSITWEKIRELFPAEWKTKDNLNAVKAEWKKHTDGKQTAEKTRQNILDMATEAQREVAAKRAVEAMKRQKKLDKQAAKQDNMAGVEALAGGG